ncbi:MAG: MFS transporter [Gammaproteobacteria bacterium]|nr:MFS transporter [Gammaproteobacteria bacterium]
MNDTAGKMHQKANSGDHISERVIVSYSSLYLPVSMALLPVSLYVIPYYAELGIGLYAMSTVIFLARLSDAFTDPLIGILSDKTKTPWGRRKPWIFAGTPLMMLSLYMLLLPPPDPTIWYFTIWIVTLYLAYTIIALPYYAWGAELSTSYDTRTHITGRREQFHFAGNLCFNFLPLTAATLIYLSATDANSIGQLISGFSGEFQEIMKARAGHIDVILGWLANFAMIAIPATVLLALIVVPAPREHRIERQPVNYWQSLSVVKRNGPYVRTIVAYTVAVAGLYITGSLSYFFVKHVIQAGELYPVYLLCYYGSSVLFLPLWVKLADRIGKDRSLIVCFVWYAFWASWIPFIPSGEFSFFLIVMCLKGTAVGAMPAIASSMAADAIDIDYARTCQQRSGLYFALWGMLRKGSGAAGGAVGLAAVAWFGFDATLDSSLAGTPEGNSAEALMWLALLYSIIPAALNFIALPLLWRYPLTAARHARLRERIDRRAAKDAQPSAAS